MAISMVLSFPITIWPMREDIIEMLAHSLGSSTQLSPTAYYLLTYTSLLAIYLVAVGIQSAYSVRWLRGKSAVSRHGQLVSTKRGCSVRVSTAAQVQTGAHPSLDNLSRSTALLPLPGPCRRSWALWAPRAGPQWASFSLECWRCETRKAGRPTRLSAGGCWRQAQCCLQWGSPPPNVAPVLGMLGSSCTTTCARLACTRHAVQPPLITVCPHSIYAASCSSAGV